MSRRHLRRAALRVAVLAPMLLVLPLGALAAQNPGDTQQVKQTFSSFFNPQTPLDQRVQLLQNGEQFKDVLQRQVKQPIAKRTSAGVSQVQVQGNRAQITYHIDVNGQPMLKNQQGTLVKENGQWKVSQDTFCDIESMQGAPPEGCSSR